MTFQIVEGGLRDQLVANNISPDSSECIQRLIEWGASEQDAKAYARIISANERRWVIPISSEEVASRWLKEDLVLDRVESTCLRHLCKIENQSQEGYGEQEITTAAEG